MEYGFWLVIIFALVYEPIFGYWDYNKFKVDVQKNQLARLQYYKNTILSLWIPTVFIWLLVIFTELTLKDIGLTVPDIDPDRLGAFITYSAIIIALSYLLGVLYYAIGYHFSDTVRMKFSQAKQKQWEHVHFSDILPVTDKERKSWTYVALTAGITEEIIYRGFLIFAIAYLFPTLSIWAVILISSLLFGLAHTYQGVTTGVLRTTLFGVIFSILYIAIGSILPLIILHILIDYIAKLGETETQGRF